MTRIKVCYIISDINKALAFEWVAEYLDKDEFELHFLLINQGGSVLENFLIDNSFRFKRITSEGKKSIPVSIFKISKYLKKNKIEVVHCHLFEANIVGLIAAKLVAIKKRIYTRHHSTFHHLYFPRAVWYDRFINWLATDIIAISENVEKVLIEKENVKPSKIHLIQHGFDLEGFKNGNEEKIQKLKLKYNSNEKLPVIGVISRYFSLKGIQYTIPAFATLLQKYPNAYLILANASGNFKAEISNLLSTLPANSFIEIPFEEDIFSLYHLFDIFVHVPINPEIEAFGQTYIEALASGIPSIFTLSGIAPEFIINGENALVVGFENSEEIYEAFIKILNNDKLKKTLTENGIKCVKDNFDLPIMIDKLQKLYLS